MSAQEILVAVIAAAVGFVAGLAWPAFVLWWNDFATGMAILTGRLFLAGCVIAGIAYVALR